MSGHPATVTISPLTATINDTGTTTVQLSATVRDISGSIVSPATLATLGLLVAWESLEPTVAQVDQTGLVTYVSAGTATIMAFLTNNPNPGNNDEEFIALS